MTFEVKKMTLDDESKIYSEKNKVLIKKFGSVDRSSCDSLTNNWIVDNERNLYYLCLKNREVRENEYHSLFSYNGEIIIIKVPFDWEPIVSFLHIPESVESNMKEIQELIKEAIKVGGRFGIGADENDLVNVKFEEIKDCK